jgi:hypothetical protein
MRAYGIHSVNDTTFCQTTPSPAESLRIVGNVIDGTDAVTANPVGVFIEWACDNRNAEITSNLIKNWVASLGGAGVSLSQCVGLDLACNNIVGNRDGLDFTRTSLADGPLVPMRQNQIKNSTVHQPYGPRETQGGSLRRP